MTNHKTVKGAIQICTDNAGGLWARDERDRWFDLTSHVKWRRCSRQEDRGNEELFGVTDGICHEMTLLDGKVTYLKDYSLSGAVGDFLDFLVRQKAKQDAKVFVDEFKFPLRYDQVLWDGDEWKDAQEHLGIETINGDLDEETFKVYKQALESESERLCSQFTGWIQYDGYKAHYEPPGEIDKVCYQTPLAPHVTKEILHTRIQQELGVELWTHDHMTDADGTTVFIVERYRVETKTKKLDWHPAFNKTYNTQADAERGIETWMDRHFWARYENWRILNSSDEIVFSRIGLEEQDV